MLTVGKKRDCLFCKKRKVFQGFTLIELLVVVVIIGLLASIAVMVAVPARNKAKNIRIQAALSQVRTQATLIVNETDSYADLCDAGFTLNEGGYLSSLGMIENDVYKLSGSNPSCYADDDNYCVQASLVPSGAYCIDSVGYAGTGKICDAANSDCE